MKKFAFLLLMSFALLSASYSCTPEDVAKDEQQIDKDCQTNPDGSQNCDPDNNGEG